MAIDPIPNALFFAPSSLTNEQSQKKKKAEKKENVTFSRVFSEIEQKTSTLISNEVLKRIEGLSTEDALQVLLSEVETQGSELRSKTTPDNLKKYRDSVQAFLHFVVNNTFDVSVSTKGLGPNKRKYDTIQIIDRKLNQLATDIFSTQQRNLSLLKRINEIQGLLIDLLL